MERRVFIKNSAILSSSALLALHCTAMKYQTIGEMGLQLWSVRHAMKQDPLSTLKSLAEIGYSDIECAGYSEGLYYGMSRAEFKQHLSDFGLLMKSSHTRTGAKNPDEKRTMTNQWEAACNDAAEMGQRSIICSSFEESERQTLDDFKRHAELFNQCGEIAKKYNLIFGHHNHDYEFLPIDGVIPYDILLEQTNPELVHFELDLYWIRKANANAFDYFEKYPGRFPVWHVKDMDDTEERFFTEVGTGVIEWPEIFKAQGQSGMQYFYVEQDEFRKHKPMDSVEISYNYLRGLKY